MVPLLLDVSENGCRMNAYRMNLNAGEVYGILPYFISVWTMRLIPSFSSVVHDWNRVARVSLLLHKIPNA